MTLAAKLPLGLDFGLWNYSTAFLNPKKMQGFAGMGGPFVQMLDVT